MHEGVRLVGESGSVAERPVPKLLVGLRGEELTGSVEIREGSGRPSVLYVRRGLPVHVVRPDSLDRLDLVLVEAGLLTSADIARAQLVRESTGRLMGQVLQDMGLVPQQRLDEALRLQLRRKVTRLFQAGEGTFEISRGDHPFGRDAASPGAPIDARSLVFPGIFANYDHRRLAAGLGELSGRRVQLAQVGGTELGELGFTAEHAPMLLHLRRSGFRLQAEWIDQQDGSPRAREAKSALLALLYLNLLEFPEEAAPDLRPAAPVPPPPVPMAARPRPAERAVVLPPPVPVVADPARAAVSPPAPVVAERAAVPPPPAPQVDPAPVRRSSTPLPDVDPAYLFALAQRFFKSGDLARAEETFEHVARAQAGNRQVQAFLAWIRFWKKQGAAREAAVELTLKAVREALRAEPNFALGHYFVGELFKLRNDMNRAENAFRAAVSHDPNMIEAQRELRLITMRRRR
jgi:hypothetical protein